MKIKIKGAREHNLKNVAVEFGDGLTVVTGISGSGKTSLVFDTLYGEARRRFQEIFASGPASQLVAPVAVESITGVGPAIAVGQNLLNRNPNSTLATAAGLHPLLRLLFTHYAIRNCPVCGLRLQVLTPDEIIEILKILSEKSSFQILAPLLHQVPGSHQTLLELLKNSFAEATILIDGQPGLQTRLNPVVPHDIEIQLDSCSPQTSLPNIRQTVTFAQSLGITALKIRQDDHVTYLAFAPVCVHCGHWFHELRPLHFNQKCATCGGRGCVACSHSGLYSAAAAALWEGRNLTEVLALTVEEFRQLILNALLPETAQRVKFEITRRLTALEAVGLSYLNLNRSTPTLSRGEAQRVRLAVALTSRLEDILHILDEPTIGLHPADVGRLMRALRQLRGPIIFVEHDRQAAALANHAVDLGPGAGKNGGEVTFSGSPVGLWQAETLTGRFFSFREKVIAPAHRSAPTEFLTLVDANLRNLKKISVPIPTGRLTVITGVSGSGKSTLIDVLVTSLTSQQLVGCRKITGPRLEPVFVDQNPIGINPRSNPATYTKLADLIRDLFAAATGLAASAFSFNRPEGACPQCNGNGAVEVKLRYLPSNWVTCTACAGQRFSEDVRAAKVQFGAQSLSIADFFDLNISDILPLLEHDARLAPAKRQTAHSILQALLDVGLGYLTLGQPSPTLSGGEAQRVKLAKFLGRKSLKTNLLVLDEPSTGLHPQDISGLLKIFDRLVRGGATLVVVEHNSDVIRAADWVIDLGPGAGAAGGNLLHAGPVASLLQNSVSRTAQALREEAQLVPGDEQTPPSPRVSAISIQNARVHNLKNISVKFPKGQLCVVTGVSGSGKSSLVHDVLETAARQRYLETLSMYERQGTREGPEAEVDEISGLGVAVSIQGTGRRFHLRSTLGLATEISHHLSILFANLGQPHCLNCGAKMMRHEKWVCPDCRTEMVLAQPRHFSAGNYAAACQKCQGVGSLQVPNPKKLIIYPEEPLYRAMYSPGFFPQGYLCKPFNGGHDLVLALAEKYKFDPAATPWNRMRPEAQHAFLFGDPEPMPVVYTSRSGKTHTRVEKFPGFYGWIRDWDVGGTYTDTQPCPVCAGAKLRPEFLSVTLAEKNIHELSELPLGALFEFFEKMAFLEVPPHSLPLELLENHLRIICRRLKFLCQVGLNYLKLNRVVGTLSAGEAQRIKLAGSLGSQLTALTVLLDEPTRGLHPVEVQALLEALQSLRDEGNTVIVVEHDPLIIRAADFLLDLGPGAGVQGGEIVAIGAPETVLQSDSLTARWLRNEKKVLRQPNPSSPENWLSIFGARENNLRIPRLDLPCDRLVGICGVSGSGKSTLLIDTLGRALAPKKQTTSVAYEPIAPGEHEKIEGAPPRTILIDQSKAGVTSPVDFLNLTKRLQTLFANSADARALGMGVSQLSRSCSACNGHGVIQLDMEFLPTVPTVCEVCQGSGYPAEAWDVKIQGFSLPEIMHRTFDEIAPLFPDPQLQIVIKTAQAVGLGYLVLRQPGVSLSGGEAQRLKIVQELARNSKSGTLYILDEPTVGQHLEDVNRLIGVLRQLVAHGNSVLVVEHHPHFLAACDWLVELGPGGGPAGGMVVATGSPEQIAGGTTPIAPFVREILEEK